MRSGRRWLTAAEDADQLGRLINAERRDSVVATEDLWSSDAPARRRDRSSLRTCGEVRCASAGPSRSASDSRSPRARAAAICSDGCGPFSPFEPGVVVGGHAAEPCDLFTAQAAGAAPGPAEQPDVLGLQRLAAFAQEVCEFWPIHNPRLPWHGGTCTPTTVARLHGCTVARLHGCTVARRYPRPGDPPITVARRPAPNAPQPRIADQWISGSLLTPAP